MTDSQATALLEEMRLLRGELDALRADLAAQKAARPSPRVTPFSVSEFAALINRHDEYVSDRCRARVIKTLPGKPYRIPVSELTRWAGIHDLTVVSEPTAA